MAHGPVCALGLTRKPGGLVKEGVDIIRFCQLVAAAAVLVSCPLFAGEGPIAVSDVAGKKLIRVSQALLNHTTAADVAGKVDAWQETGYDGLCFGLSIDPAAVPEDYPHKHLMSWRWWDTEERKHAEFERDIEAFRSVEDWGRLTDNFLLMNSHVKGNRPPDWFSDDDWTIVVANTRLAARIAKEIGFKGIAFDWEGYGGGTYGVWRQPWDYSLYARGDYTIENRDAPRPFDEVAAKVRQRGRQWAEALSAAYADMVLAVLPGIYESAWHRANEPRFEGDLAKCDVGLWPAFVDGILEGLDERALLVGLSESTYLDSEYRDFLIWRNFAREQALVIAADPERARGRISFAAGIWTDAGYGYPRFSTTDERFNQRDPERHRHAVHNSLAASDHYAWQWGEWGTEGESNFMTTEPTPLMRRYWQANIDAHAPMDLFWEVEPYHDHADHTAADAEAAGKDAELWPALAKQGYLVAVTLPEYWKFRFDPETKVRYSNWMSPDCDDRSWFTVKSTRCWQSQGTRANGPGVYRVKFDAPADLDPEKQEIVLAFGGLGGGGAHLYINGGWLSHMRQVIDVSEMIKPGESNQVGIVFLNKTGPGGLMGQVKLLVRDRTQQRE